MSGVLVDTCVWSLALRGNAPKEVAVAEQLSQLIDENQVRIIGPIRQELLSGYTDKNSFERLRQKIQYFPNEAITDGDYESAAEYSRIGCRVFELLPLERRSRIAHRFLNMRCIHSGKLSHLHNRQRFSALFETPPDLALVES